MKDDENGLYRALKSHSRGHEGLGLVAFLMLRELKDHTVQQARLAT